MSATASSLTPGQQRFLEVLCESQILKFGSFVTKSGRQTPFFFNTGHLDSGERISQVAACYAEAIAAQFPDVENLFGPAYKGIPLAVATAQKLSEVLGRDVSFTFNRKEAKDHGEKGVFVGRTYDQRTKVVVIEDVITGGTSLRESHPLLASTNAQVVGVIVGVDRQEKGRSEKAASQEIADLYGVPFVSLLNIEKILAALPRENGSDGTAADSLPVLDDVMRGAISQYMQTYGSPRA